MHIVLRFWHKNENSSSRWTSHPTPQCCRKSKVSKASHQNTFLFKILKQKVSNSPQMAQMARMCVAGWMVQKSHPMSEIAHAIFCFAFIGIAALLQLHAWGIPFTAPSDVRR